MGHDTHKGLVKEAFCICLVSRAIDGVALTVLTLVDWSRVCDPLLVAMGPSAKIFER